MSKKLLRTLAENTMLRNMKVHKRFEMIRAQTERVPATSEELAELELYFENTLARGASCVVVGGCCLSCGVHFVFFFVFV